MLPTPTPAACSTSLCHPVPAQFPVIPHLTDQESQLTLATSWLPVHSSSVCHLCSQNVSEGQISGQSV